MRNIVLILMCAVKWLFFGRNRRRFTKVWATYKAGGMRLCWYRAIEKFGRTALPYDPFRYQLSPSQSSFILSRCSNQPLISIVTPVYKVEKEWLEKCIRSVINQHYSKWEMILVNDTSEKNDLKQLMDNWALQDNRIQAFHLEENDGIAAATNFGIKHAKGEFIGFLDCDDELTPDALIWVVWAINKHPKGVWFYSDEDKIFPNGDYCDPHFKPDFSPELLLSNMFTCHFSVYSAKILNEAGGIRSGFEGSQDHDLALRISEVVRSDQVIHIPRVLYHWRTVPGSAALSIEEKPQAAISGRKAVEEALIRRKIKGTVIANRLCPTLYHIALEPTSYPKVSVIISTKNSLSLVKKCLKSLRNHTNYPNYEIMVIDNQSDNKLFLEFIEQERAKNRLKVIQYDKPFNHSDMNNKAVNSTNSDVIVLMNNDIEIITDNWLEQLVATVNLDESIACAGCLLIYKNLKVQHGGIILGIQGHTGHSHQYIDSKLLGYHGRLQSLQQISALTAALVVFKRDKFESVGGFRADRYPTLYNDVDICLRLRKRGFRCIYNPMVQAIHHESKTRPIIAEDFDYKKIFMDEYSDILKNDPFYNPNLSLDNQQFIGCRPFPVEEQIPELAGLSESNQSE